MNKIITTKKVLYSLYLILSVFVCLELILHIYNPFHFRIRGNEVILETNKKYVIDNSRIPVLDSEIVHSKNNLGYRGPDKPADFKERLTVVTIGGSTTECAYLDDSKTWPYLLYKRLQPEFPGIWLNNAGVAGHSTFGHIALLKDHIIPLRPKYALLLVGANDIRREKIAADDSFTAFLASNSELINVLVNLWRTREARQKNLTDTYINLSKADSLALTDAAINDYISGEVKHVRKYVERLKTVIALCRDNNISPILITQPSLVGRGVDPVTGVSLVNIKLRSNTNGKLWWTMLEKYNDGTRALAMELNIPLIDLAHQLPKSSAYFYDIVHFTNEGAEKTASILFEHLVRVLQR